MICLPQNARPFENAADTQVTGKGGVIDLVLPVIILIICCVIGMIYTGGFFNGTDFITAFSQCSASEGWQSAAFSDFWRR